DSAHFPEDLVFQETADRANFQGRYVLRHAWTGGDTCGAAADYHRALRDRHDREAERLASLTGWNVEDIRKKMGPEPAPQGARVGALHPRIPATPLPRRRRARSHRRRARARRFALRGSVRRQG